MTAGKEARKILLNTNYRVQQRRKERHMWRAMRHCINAAAGVWLLQCKVGQKEWNSNCATQKYFSKGSRRIVWLEQGSMVLVAELCKETKSSCDPPTRLLLVVSPLERIICWQSISALSSQGNRHGQLRGRRKKRVLMSFVPIPCPTWLTFHHNTCPVVCTKKQTIYSPSRLTTKICRHTNCSLQYHGRILDAIATAARCLHCATVQYVLCNSSSPCHRNAAKVHSTNNGRYLVVKATKKFENVIRLQN